MPAEGRRALATTQRLALLGVADDSAGQFIAREAGRIARAESVIPVVATREFRQLIELTERFDPAVTLIDESLMNGLPNLLRGWRC